VKLLFDTYGNDKQKEVARHWIDPEVFDIVYGGSKGSGKSYLGCSLIFGDALTYPGTHYFIARKKLNDLRKFTIPSIYEVFKHWGLTEHYYKFNAQDSVFTLYNGSKVFLLEAKYHPSDPLYMRFGSMQMTRGWIEEAGEFEVAAKNNLAASIGRWKNDTYKIAGKLLQTCNPSKNYLYRDYYKKFKEKTLELWKRFVQALPEDNKRLPDGYLETLRRTLSVAEKERLLKGNWEYDDDPATLIQYDQICDIFTNDYVRGGQKYITADIARLGKDTTIIRVWDGWRVIERVQRKKIRITESAELIKTLANKYSIPMSRVIADEGGVGGGVIDILHCMGFIGNAKPVVVSAEYDAEGKPVLPNYDMLKSQCGFKLAEMVNLGLVYESCTDDTVKEIIIEEFEQLKQKSLGTDKKLGLMPKEDIIELIARSPDELDTYIMRAFFDLKPVAKAPTLTFHR
jgi:phage terminase large subunit